MAETIPGIGERQLDDRAKAARDCARRVLLAGVWLIENGYGGMGIMPYVYATGHWRCEFHPPGKPSKPLFRYTIANEYKFLASHCGGTVRKDINPARLAEAILVSVPSDTRDACSGEASERTKAWITELRGQLELGRVPQAFGESFGAREHWALDDLVGGTEGLSMSAMPGYVKPGQEACCLDDAFWAAAERRARRLAKRHCVAIPSSVLRDDDACFDLADRLRRDMVDANPFDALRLLRASIGAVHIRRARMLSMTIEVTGAGLYRATCRRDAEAGDPAALNGSRIAQGWLSTSASCMRVGPCGPPVASAPYASSFSF